MDRDWRDWRLAADSAGGQSAQPARLGQAPIPIRGTDDMHVIVSALFGPVPSDVERRSLFPPRDEMR